MELLVKWLVNVFWLYLTSLCELIGSKSYLKIWYLDRLHKWLIFDNHLPFIIKYSTSESNILRHIVPIFVKRLSLQTLLLNLVTPMISWKMSSPNHCGVLELIIFVMSLWFICPNLRAKVRCILQYEPRPISL